MTLGGELLASTPGTRAAGGPARPLGDGAGAGTSPLVIRNVAKTYEGSSDPALVDISMELRPAERISLLGPSGSGKSTLLHILSGFVSPDSGTVLIGGRDSTHVSVRSRDIGLVFQSLALFPHMTVEQNVAFGLRMHKVPRKEREIAVAEALKIVELESFATRRPAQLSGGQRQRVAFARAIVTRPSVLLLDEPFGALDTRLREGIRREFIDLQEETGISTILVTHDQAEALEFGHRVAVMGEGRLLQMDTPQAVYRRPSTLFVAGFVGQGSTLRGTVQENADSHVVLRTEGGEHLTVPTDHPLSDVSVGTDVVVFVRPEWVRVLPEGSAGIPATVGRVQFAGARSGMVCITAGGEELSCETEEGSSFREGDAVAVDFAPGHRPCIYRASDGRPVR